MTSIFSFSNLALWVAPQITVACSKHPKTPGMVPFWNDVFIVPFSVTYFVKRNTTTEKKDVALFMHKRFWSKLLFFPSSFPPCRYRPPQQSSAAYRFSGYSMLLGKFCATATGHLDIFCTVDKTHHWAQELIWFSLFALQL